MTDPNATPTTNPAMGEGKLTLPTSLYDAAKEAALIYLPAVGTLYFTLASIWGLPAAEQVVGTISAIIIFLGVVLKISNVSYNNSDKSNDGTLVVDQSDPLKDKYLLNVTTPLNDVAGANKITLKVDNQTKNVVAAPPTMDQRLIKPDSQ